MQRNWRAYNRALVKRGEALLTFDFLKRWDDEVREANREKVGRPFTFPNSLIFLLIGLKAFFHLPYRQLEGVARRPGKLAGFPTPDHTTLISRVRRLKIELPDHSDKEDLVIAVDSSGLKVTNRGEWIRKNGKKGYIKIHVAVNTKTKEVVELSATEEKIHDSREFKKLVKGAFMKAVKRGGKIKKVIADSASDSFDNFKLVDSIGAEPVIRVREWSWAHGDDPRSRSVKEQMKDRKGWAKKAGYGMRWMAESFFSAFKRTFGEWVWSRRFDSMVKEVKLKVCLYNLMLRVA